MIVDGRLSTSAGKTGASICIYSIIAHPTDDILMSVLSTSTCFPRLITHPAIQILKSHPVPRTWALNPATLPNDEIPWVFPVMHPSPWSDRSRGFWAVSPSNVFEWWIDDSQSTFQYSQAIVDSFILHRMVEGLPGRDWTWLPTTTTASNAKHPTTPLAGTFPVHTAYLQWVLSFRCHATIALYAGRLSCGSPWFDNMTFTLGYPYQSHQHLRRQSPTLADVELRQPYQSLSRCCNRIGITSITNFHLPHRELDRCPSSPVTWEPHLWYLNCFIHRVVEMHSHGKLEALSQKKS